MRSACLASASDSLFHVVGLQASAAKEEGLETDKDDKEKERDDTGKLKREVREGNVCVSTTSGQEPSVLLVLQLPSIAILLWLPICSYLSRFISL